MARPSPVHRMAMPVSEPVPSHDVRGAPPGAVAQEGATHAWQSLPLASDSTPLSRNSVVLVPGIMSEVECANLLGASEAWVARRGSEEKGDFPVHEDD